MPNEHDHILLVEDSIDVRYFAVDVLSGADYLVTAVSLGEEAIRVAAGKRFDLILMDISLPDMTGFEVARAIRAAEANCTKTPILAFTSHNSQSHRERAASAGMDNYLTKPILPEVLLEAVRQEISRARRTSQSASSTPDLLVDGAQIDATAKPQLSPLVEGYLRRVGDSPRLIAKHLQDQSWHPIMVIGHNLKGTGGTYGFAQLSAIGARLEQAAIGRNQSQVEAITAELSKWLAEIQSP